MIRALIIDDEPECITALTLLLKEYLPEVSILGTASSCESGLQLIQRYTGSIDLLFLDVQMPDGDGFSLLKALDKVNFAVIFVTAFDQYALRAIKFSALDYLLKPVHSKDLEEAVNKLKNHPMRDKGKEEGFREKLQNNTLFERLAIPSLTDINFIELRNIQYLESEKNYTTFYQLDGHKITSSKNIGYYEELLSLNGFFRIHNSYIVNLAQVKRYIKGKGGYVELMDGSKLEVSARRKDDLFQILGLH